MSRETDDMQLSIGAVSRATDIPVGTLRTWERRYDFPDPERNDAGHRVYERDVVERLRLTNRALDAGHRPSNVVGLTTEELRKLVEPSSSESAESANEAVDEISDWRIEVDDDWIRSWLRATSELDGPALNRLFRNAWNTLGPLDFLQHRASPFLEKVGEAWSRGDLEVVHEHYASECMRDFLSARWRPRSSQQRGPMAVLATPEGELHALGLHMVATLLAVAGWQIVFLGPNTPVDELAKGCRERDVDAAAVSISRSFATQKAVAFLDETVGQLPDDVDLLAGGGGAPNVEGLAAQISSLEDLYDWAFQRAN